MKAQENNNDIQENLSQLADDTRSLLAATANNAEDAVVEARNRVRSALEATSETCARVKAKAIDGAKYADKAIRENPYQAVGIAFGVGALLGLLLARRSRD